MYLPQEELERERKRSPGSAPSKKEQLLDRVVVAEPAKSAILASSYLQDLAVNEEEREAAQEEWGSQIAEKVPNYLTDRFLNSLFLYRCPNKPTSPYSGSAPPARFTRAGSRDTLLTTSS